MGEQETPAERSARLAAEVGSLLPELTDSQVMAVIGPVLNQAMELTNETEGHFKVAKNELDVSALMSVMVQGALAAICEGHVEEDIRGRLFRAGKLVGEYATERMQHVVEEEVEAARRDKVS